MAVAWDEQLILSQWHFSQTKCFAHTSSINTFDLSGRLLYQPTIHVLAA